jgi:hypothetical protein
MHEEQCLVKPIEWSCGLLSNNIVLDQADSQQKQMW